jgi:hypothetical protein
LSELFYHRLALKLHRTVPELLATTTSMELTKWAGYYIHEPFGNEWAAFAKLAGWIAATGGHKDPTAVERDFPPARYEKPLEQLIEEAKAEEQTEEQIKAQLAKINPNLFRPLSELDGGNGK